MLRELVLLLLERVRLVLADLRGVQYLSEVVAAFGETRMISTPFPTVKAIFLRALQVPIFIFWRRMMDLRRFM